MLRQLHHMFLCDVFTVYCYWARCNVMKSREDSSRPQQHRSEHTARDIKLWAWNTSGANTA